MFPGNLGEGLGQIPYIIMTISASISAIASIAIASIAALIAVMPINTPVAVSINAPVVPSVMPVVVALEVGAIIIADVPNDTHLFADSMCHRRLGDDELRWARS